MRFSVVGADPETGQSLEMVVDAPSLEEAASAARRRHVRVMSVSPAELPPAAAAPEPTTVREQRASRSTITRPGKSLRRTTTFALVIALLVVVSYPAISIVTAVALLVAVGTFVCVPRTRDRLRCALGVWPDMPVRGAFKLTALGAYAVLLILLVPSGREMMETMRREQEQQRAIDAAAAQRTKELATEVRTLLGEARSALQSGDIAGGEALARQAAAVKMAPNRDDAQELVDKIERANDPGRALEMLTKLPDHEFAAFSEKGQLAASFDLGFEILNARQLEVAKTQVGAAVEQRAKLAAEEQARKDEARKKDEARAQQERARREAAERIVQDKVDAYVAVLDAGGVSLVENVSAQVSDDIWEATLTVSNLWHIRHKQIRLQDAQALWEAWARIASPKKQDSARIRIVDYRGNEVGGSRLWGGSLIWVND
jgi:hypothetical protein